MRHPDKHLHLLASNGPGPDNRKLSGKTQPLTVEEVRAELHGTPYLDQPSLTAVLDGTLDLGYSIPPTLGGWVCVTTCVGTDENECLNMLTSAAASGDIRLRAAATTRNK